MNKVYTSQYARLPGTSYSEVLKVSRHHYHVVQKKTPRRKAYVRSKFFADNKVFINEFWNHLQQKNPADRLRRLPFFLCALDLVRNSRITPQSAQNPGRNSEMLHRFVGQTKDNEKFAVQVKENKATSRLDCMSVFPIKSDGNYK